MVKVRYEMTEKGYERLKDGFTEIIQNMTNEPLKEDLKDILEREFNWKTTEEDKKVIINLDDMTTEEVDDFGHFLCESIINSMEADGDDKIETDYVRQIATVLLNSMFMAGSKIIVETKED